MSASDRLLSEGEGSEKQSSSVGPAIDSGWRYAFVYVVYIHGTNDRNNQRIEKKIVKLYFIKPQHWQAISSNRKNNSIFCWNQC